MHLHTGVATEGNGHGDGAPYSGWNRPWDLRKTVEKWEGVGSTIEECAVRRTPGRPFCSSETLLENVDLPEPWLRLRSHKFKINDWSTLNELKARSELARVVDRRPNHFLNSVILRRLNDEYGTTFTFKMNTKHFPHSRPN